MRTLDATPTGDVRPSLGTQRTRNAAGIRIAFRDEKELVWVLKKVHKKRYLLSAGFSKTTVPSKGRRWSTLQR